VVLEEGSEEGGVSASVLHLVNAVDKIADTAAGRLEGLRNPIITGSYISLAF
jgi:hypothetical protein